MHDIRLLTFKQVQERVNLTRGQIYRLMGKGEFPLPLKLGRASRWRSDEIENWITADHHPRGTFRPQAQLTNPSG